MNRLKPKELALYFFGLATIACAFLVNPDGYFVNDEAIYHMMTVSLANEGNLFIWNGYEEFPSPELVPSLARAFNGHLYPQYPVFFSIIAYPFVYFLGFKGFFVVYNLFNLGRPQVSADHHRNLREGAFTEWGRAVA